MVNAPDTQDRILDAAKAVFFERGSSGARMQEIADGAGVNKALLHYYFSNKETLATAVFQRELRRLIQPVMETLGSALALPVKVRRVVELYLDALSALPGLPGYVLAELNFHPERIEDFVASVVGAAPRETGERVLAVLDAQIRAEVDADRMRPIRPEQFAVNLLALCVFPFAARPLITLLMLGHTDFDAFISERKQTLPDFFLGALRP